jgi:hypothetical protein
MTTTGNTRTLSLAWFEDLHASVGCATSDLQRVVDQVWQRTLGPVRSVQDEELHKTLNDIAKALQGITVEIEATMDDIEEKAEKAGKANGTSLASRDGQT